MPGKVQYYTDLAEKHARHITGSRENWTGFLETAGRLYKYPFEEQLMIHAQRPDAQACASYELWNKKMNRYIKRGSKAIALLNTAKDGSHALKYVFDYADTEDGWRNARRPFFWQMSPELEKPVIEAIAQNYNFTESTNDFGNMLYTLASNLSTRYYNDNARDIYYSAEDSFLEELDELNIEMAFREAMTVSTAYTLMSRCGVNTADYIYAEDFQPIFDFNSPSAVYALGKAVSTVTEEVLRDIEVVVKTYERNKIAERGKSNERIGLHSERGLFVPEFGNIGDNDGASRQIRINAEDIPERTPSNIIHGVFVERKFTDSLPSNSTIGGRTADSDYERFDSEESAAGQRNESDGLGGSYEQPESSSGGIYHGGIDLQLNGLNNESSPAEPTANSSNEMPLKTLEDDTDIVQLKEVIEKPPEKFDETPPETLAISPPVKPPGISLNVQLDIPVEAPSEIKSDGVLFYSFPKIPSEYEQIELILKNEEEARTAGQAVITQDDIDAAIIRWNGDIDSIFNVYSYMKDNGRARSAAEFLKNEYGGNFYDFPVEKDGFVSEHIPWPKIQRRICQLIESGAFSVPEKVEQNHNQSVLSKNPKQAVPPVSPPPVFFINWNNAKFDFDLSMYKDRDVIGYDIEGVRHVLGRSGNLTYVTSTGAVWGSNDVPGEIYSQIKDYQNGAVTDEQVRTNYLDILQTYRNNIKKPAHAHTKTPEQTLEQTLDHTSENFKITDDHLGEGGAKTKYNFNISAIRTLKDIESENRTATPDEQKILSKYVGWGGIPQVFDKDNSQWEREYKELINLLSKDEYEMARASTLNAHYTPPAVIKAMYETIDRLGFKEGNVLEPACGIGNFFGFLPDTMRHSKLYGVELDSITGRIARQLYPAADIRVTGYEKTETPDAFFDLAVGNVPFGSYKLNDQRYNKHNFYIHDYFIAKTLDQVRPGGIIAFITTKGTLDKANPDIRKYIAQRAELLGAVRLPNNAFLKNAGTEVTCDIIFLQKRDRMMDVIPEWVHLGKTDDGVPVNQYFINNPLMILGTMAFDDRMYGNKNETTCIPADGADLAEQLRIALSNINGQFFETELDELADEMAVRESVPADPAVRNFSYTVIADEVHYRENSRMYPVDMPSVTLERVKGMTALRDITHKLIQYQLDDYPEEQIKQAQTELNRLYDGFTGKYGLINTSANSRAFSSDSSYYLLCSLEILNENGELERKSDMFSKRTIKQNAVITSVDTSIEALAVSIAQKAKVDMDTLTKLTGFEPEKILDDLQGIVFCDIGNPNHNLPEFDPDKMKVYDKFPLVTADEYLSGNVREKLKKATEFNEVCGDFFYGVNTKANVKALEQAQPKDLDASEISVRLGATWVDKNIIQDFMYDLLQTPRFHRSIINVAYSEKTAEWNISGKSVVSYSDVLATSTYGTSRANAYKIMEDTLNLRDVRIYDTVTDADGKEKRVVNKKETMLACQRQEAIKEKFKDWIFNDPDRRQYLVEKYNRLFNSTRPREYDGSHIEFSGISPDIELKPHQTAAIARILYGGNTLLAHEVGAGKTFEMVGAVMESKRLGLCHKSLIAVPNHLTEQTAAEFLRLYPSANLLVATRKDFETKNRKKFCAKISTGEYDAVIIGHSQLEKIPLSKERQERLLKEQIYEITDGIDELKKNRGERFTIKQLEKTKKNLESRLAKLTDDSRKDDVVTFEQLGVDRLIVDESHSFKNLFLYTKMRNVAGLSTSEAQKSSDLFAKCRYIDELTGNKGVIFATGTPISNSMAEMYTVQRYLQYDTLVKNGHSHFDAWASNFGETVTSVELSPEGSGYRARTRFAKFNNLPELMNIFKEVADIKTADTLDLPRPKAIFYTVVAPPTDIQKEMVQALSERAKAVHDRKVDPTEDNMLLITSDGRKIGLDQRLMNPLLPDDPHSKVNMCVQNVFRIWEDTIDKRSTQILFCDFSTPNKDGKFNIYDDIKTKLIGNGIPENEIAFIHDYNTEIQKKELFAKVRKGQIRILLGSTFKCGSGTNIQDRLIALHDIDCPWRPADLAQRTGRILRQGNQNPEVKIFRYVTESTFDSYLFQTVEKKQQFIGQIMTSKSPVRSCDDIDEDVLSYAEIKALCAGNPHIKEKMQLDIEVSKLKMLKADHQSQQYRLQDDLLKNFPKRIESARANIEGFKSDIKRLETYTHKTEESISPMVIGNQTYTDRGEAGSAILQACKTIITTEPVKIGCYRGFDMLLSYNSVTKKFMADMKNSMTHSAELGDDGGGNITRINNAFDKIPQRLMSAEAHLETLQNQQINAKAELGKPFDREQELAEKTARLAELNSTLNLDEKPDAVIIGDIEDEAIDTVIAAITLSKDLTAEPMSAKTKPSILENLERYAEQSRITFGGGWPDNAKIKEQLI